MNPWIFLLIFFGVIFVADWLFSLALDRTNRKVATQMADTLSAMIELEGHIVHVIEDLQRIEPAKEEILELVRLQMDSVRDSMTTQRGVMQVMSTKRSPLFVFLPVAKAAAQQVRRNKADKARQEQIQKLLGEHGETSS